MDCNKQHKLATIDDRCPGAVEEVVNPVVNDSESSEDGDDDFFLNDECSYINLEQKLRLIRDPKLKQMLSCLRVREGIENIDKAFNRTNLMSSYLADPDFYGVCDHLLNLLGYSSPSEDVSVSGSILSHLEEFE